MRIDEFAPLQLLRVNRDIVNRKCAASPKAVAKEIVRRLQQAGFAAFWVGGCVRDFLLGREPQDFDIATDAKPEQVEKLFRKTIPVGKKFGVIIVVEGGHQFQVATFRAEADYQDGRRPEKIVFANAEADASRRDFTVNGLFYDPLTKKIHDWVGGEKDLRAKIIRTIGEPEERFGEDHLRMLRAVRFAAQLDFEIEPKTFAAVQKLAPKIKIISAERVRDELIKLFRPPHAARGLVLLRDSGLLEHILPELAATIGCEQSPDFHPEGSVFNHICLMLEKMPADADGSLPWAVLLHDIAKPVTAERDAATGKIHFYGHEKVGADMAERNFAAAEIFQQADRGNRRVRAASHAVQGREADAQGDAAAAVVARDVSAGTGIAPAGLPRLARRFGKLQFSGRAGGGIETSAGKSVRRC